MSAEALRRAAALMRERAEAATPGRWEHVEAFHASFVCFPARDDLDTVAATKILRADNRPGRRKDKRDAAHIASWHPAVALAVADWLEAVAEVHWPRRHDRYSESHYNADPEHDFTDCDETCWQEAYICNGCGTTDCKPEISGRALSVARAYLGEQP